ncbi:DinB family protein [Aneurinibacillus migulanus]|uniref:DinB superfamily protein n=1 Tax=Aneurinibacillus migulanus TaxID=47500 RepID=A0A0D1XU74_ANEMI|nr:DinB family protein [Aneurinibacillus migulanus]KIV57766.1 PadR family transcriptional regulator [Aneurinibacillus migulanus]KON97137.1 PadR family transcriptional regulator [Aneurinibacillus migulanus]MED0896429.1 DinB family protein [Aneurinibacillus migulanus]MED1616088.1 DinB family protein [Aneurinibacillus migulanus]SDJ96152.1 DinB superfamily protein [Aneurinibacillus migulanus]
MNKLVNDNLYETRNNLVKEITLLSNAQFNSKPDMNKWSIAQVCHHLVLVEKASIKAITWGLKGIDSAQKERKKVHLILDRTKKINAPKIVEPDVEPFEVQQIIDLLNDSRKKLITFLSTIEDKSILAEKSVKHPAFGELPLDQWIEQIYLHEQRHIEQIKEIKLLLDARH